MKLFRSEKKSSFAEINLDGIAYSPELNSLLKKIWKKHRLTLVEQYQTYIAPSDFQNSLRMISVPQTENIPDHFVIMLRLGVSAQTRPSYIDLQIILKKDLASPTGITILVGIIISSLELTMEVMTEEFLKLKQYPYLLLELGKRPNMKKFNSEKELLSFLETIVS